MNHRVHRRLEARTVRATRPTAPSSSARAAGQAIALHDQHIENGQLDPALAIDRHVAFNIREVRGPRSGVLSAHWGSEDNDGADRPLLQKVEKARIHPL